MKHRILVFPNYGSWLQWVQTDQTHYSLLAILVNGFSKHHSPGKYSVSTCGKRSHTLRINYRTSHQIRMQADLLLESTLSDVDGNMEDRRGTKSAFNGRNPIIMVLDTPEEEQQFIHEWLKERLKEGLSPEEIAVFVRSTDELARAQAAVEQAELLYKVLDENAISTTGQVSISTMHNAKGLEFKAVAVMACDSEVIPLQGRIEAVTDQTDLD